MKAKKFPVINPILNLVLINFILSALLVPIAYGANYYVATAGDDGNAGTEAAPFKTIQHAADLVKPGDIVEIRGGVYREKVNVKKSGTPDQPITLRAYSGEDVTVNGAELVTGWKPCTACGNSNIYYTTIDWNTIYLFEDGAWLTNARIPKFGYFNGTSASPFDYISDTVNITKPNEYFAGAKIEIEPTADRGALCWMYDKLMVSSSEPGVLHLTQSHNTDWAPWDSLDGLGVNPWYYLHNKKEYIEQPGEWAIDTTTTPYTVYLWPLKGGDPNNYQIEAPKRTEGVTLLTYPANPSYIVFDGINVTKVNLYPDWYAGGVGYYLANGTHVTVKNAAITYNAGSGITIRNPNGHHIENNTVAYNLFGIANGGGSVNPTQEDVLNTDETFIEGNHVHHNLEDGIVIYREVNFTVRNNHIHHHMTDLTHTDNFQTWLTINVKLENNIIHDGGQDVIMQDSDNIIFKKNLVYYSEAQPFVFDRATQVGLLFDGNTIGYARYTPLNLANDQEVFKNNFLYTGYANFGMNTVQGHLLSSDYNYFADTYKTISYGGTYYPIANWLNDQHFDAHSLFGGAILKNVPLALYPKKPFYPPDTIGIDNANTIFHVGDVVENNDDGIVRRVTEVGMDTIKITPRLENDNIGSMWSGYILYWGGNTNLEEDWRPLGGEACVGSDTQGPIGALACVDCESDSPLALFLADTVYGYAPMTVNFDGRLSKSCGGTIMDYGWDFGDGAVSDGSQTQHVFKSGVYTVKLTVTNSLGLSNTYSKSVTVLPAAVPNLNLYLNMDDNVRDLSGKNNHGAWQGTASYAAGKYDNAAAMDGTATGAYVLVKDDELLRGMSQLTLSVWAKKNTAAVGGEVINKHVHYRLAVGQNSVGGYIGTTVKADYFSGTAAVNDTQWHHYAVAYDGTQTVVYVDGNEVTRRSLTGMIYNDGSRDVYIGKDPWGNTFSGAIDELKIYDRALSATEVGDLFRYDPQNKSVYGDVSGDNEVTAYDAALTAQASVGLITLTVDQAHAAEVSGDGEVTAYDAALIAQKSVGLIATFPVEG